MCFVGLHTWMSLLQNSSLSQKPACGLQVLASSSQSCQEPQSASFLHLSVRNWHMWFAGLQVLRVSLHSISRLQVPGLFRHFFYAVSHVCQVLHCLSDVQLPPPVPMHPEKRKIPIIPIIAPRR